MASFLTAPPHSTVATATLMARTVVVRRGRHVPMPIQVRGRCFDDFDNYADRLKRACDSHAPVLPGGGFVMGLFSVSLEENGALLLHSLLALPQSVKPQPRMIKHIEFA